MKKKSNAKDIHKEAIKIGWDLFMTELRNRGVAVIDSGAIPASPVHLVELILNEMISELKDQITDEDLDQNCSTGKIVN